MLIREAGPHDAIALESLYHQLVRNPRVSVHPDRLAEILEDPRNFVFVAQASAEDDPSDDGAEQLLGTASLTLCLDAMFDFAPYGVVENLVVTSGARRRGVGAALLEHIEGVARDAEASKLMLQSRVDRVDAHRLLRRLGWDDQRKRGFVKYLG